MAVHQSTASNLMEKLESSGYILRTRSIDDKRVVYLEITPKGRALLEKCPPPYRGILPDALQNLNKLVSTLEHKQVDAGYEPLGNE